MKTNDIYARPSYAGENKSNLFGIDNKQWRNMLLTGGLMMPKQLHDEKKKREEKKKQKELELKQAEVDYAKAQEVDALQLQLAKQQAEQEAQTAQDELNELQRVEEKGSRNMIYVAVGGVLVLATVGYFLYKAMKK